MERIPLTGKRLKLAREAIAIDNPNLLTIKFKEYNREKGYAKGKGLPEARRTIIDWEENDIPARSVKLGLDNLLDPIADFFGVEPDLFTENHQVLDINLFCSAIRNNYNKKSKYIKKGTDELSPPFIINSQSVKKVNPVLGRRLKLARKFKGLTQEDMIEHLSEFRQIVGIKDVTAIKRYEKGLVPLLKISKIAKYLKVPIDYIIDDRYSDDDFLNYFLWANGQANKPPV